MLFAGAFNLVGAWTIPADADPNVAKIAKRLSDGSSFQVRVQAALALGASGSSAAVAPLCGALNDEAASVRAAAGAALGRLKKASAKSCLKARIGRESNGSVKSQLERALARVERETALRNAASASRTPTRKSRFYVAVDPTKSKGGRRKQDVELIVQATIRQSLMAENNVGLAPSGQDKNQFEQVAQKHRVQGYLLRPTVESIAYDGSNVSVAFRLTLFSYPSMALQAEYAPKLSMSGTTGRDREAEDKLLRMATEKAIQKFLETTK
jgi:HEAT repeats